MEQACKSCTHTIEGNFCSECGQKKYKRIDRKYLIDEVQYIAIHTNKGFFYSVKNILKNPGKTARDFIEGNRVNHYKPLYLAFILSGISTFIAYKLVDFNTLIIKYFEHLGTPTSKMDGVFQFMTSYISMISLMLVPIFAVFTYLVFRKWGQNYYEHVIMNAYFQCYYTIIYIFIYPLIYILGNNMFYFGLILTGLMLILPFLSVWFYKGFYSDKPLKNIIFKVFLVFLLVFICYILSIILIIILKLLMN